VSILVIVDGASIAAMIFRIAPPFGQSSKSMPNATLAHQQIEFRPASDRCISGTLGRHGIVRRERLAMS